MKIVGFALIGISGLLLSFLLGRLSIEKDVKALLKNDSENETEDSDNDAYYSNR